MRQLIVGLTGGIGSSKSLTAQVFKRLGIDVYISDDRAKQLYKDKSLQLQLQEIFGPTIVKNNVIDKRQLSDIVFNNKDYLNRLNNLIHPLVKTDFLQWQSHAKSPYVIMESAIIFEIGWQDMFDKIVCVTVPKHLVMERLLKRDGVGQDKIISRMNNQMNPSMKAAKSDFIITNDDEQSVLQQILKIDSSLRKLYNEQRL